MAIDDRRGSAKHPEAERLAEYAEGVLPGSERGAVEEHLAACDNCRAVVTDAMAFMEAEQGRTASNATARQIPFRRTRRVTGIAAALTMAAALILVARVVRPGLFSGGSVVDRPELQDLAVALAHEPTRPVEGRLAGGFAYAPPPSLLRGPADHEVSPDVRIAAAKIAKAAQDGNTEDSEVALGDARLALGDVDNAIKALEAAVQRRPNSAFAQNDLAVAYLARSQRNGRTEDLPRALAAADRAIKAAPWLNEPYFNRALALEALNLTSDARLAWNEYLGRDPKSAWATEASRHVRALGASLTHGGDAASASPK